MNFICIKPFVGRNLAFRPVEVPVGSKLEKRGDFLFWKEVPLCLCSSSVARHYFLVDDNFEKRLQYMNEILDESRTRQWLVAQTKVDENTGKVLGVEKILKQGRFTPEEIEYIQTHWPKWVIQGPALNFNEEFYANSSIEELAKLAQYCREKH